MDGRLGAQRRSAAGQRVGRPCGDGSQKGCLGLDEARFLLVCLFRQQEAFSIMRDEFLADNFQ